MTSAQRNPVYASLEAYAAGAEGVYLGLIAEMGSGEPTDVVLDVKETLKGEKRKRVSAISYDAPHLPDAWRAWKRRRTPLLGFVRRPEPGSPEIVTPLFPVDPAEGDGLPIVGYFSMDFRLLRDPHRILETVRRYARTGPQTAAIHSLRYMPDLIRKQFPYNTGGELLVPVTPHLERIARRMVLDPGSFLPDERDVYAVTHDEYRALKPIDEGRLRRIGVEALGRFKSRANIALIKRFLDDPFVEPHGDDEKDVYGVRKAAYRALMQWGITVPTPPATRPETARPG